MKCSVDKRQYLEFVGKGTEEASVYNISNTSAYKRLKLAFHVRCSTRVLSGSTTIQSTSGWCGLKVRETQGLAATFTGGDGEKSL